MLMPFHFSWAQDDSDELTIVFDAQRDITPAYRITEHPVIIDTVIPLPKFEYPLLTKSMTTSITTSAIEPSKLKIINKLDKLYPGYVKVGLGNYTMPMGELYYNSVRNRRFNYGIHANHLSSFGQMKGYAPSQYDNTNAKIFGEYYSRKHIYTLEGDWLNHGYHYYGIQNDSIPKDSLKNRVGAYGAKFTFGNYTKRDSAKLIYKLYTDYRYFHEFLPDSANETSNARENHFTIGSEWAYKFEDNVFHLDADFKFNQYRYGEDDSLLFAYQRNVDNHILHFRPTVSSYRFDDKLKAEVGFDLNFDIDDIKIFKPLVVANVKYSLLDGMIIPYIAIDGGLKQNTYYGLNRENPYINSSIDLKNTKTFEVKGGIKGTLSKHMTFNVFVHSSKWTDMPLYVNDTIFSDQYRFNVVYDTISVLGIGGSLSYQLKEKLKVDAMVEYNKYFAKNQLYAWNLPEFKMTLRGSYNLYDKIYAKLDFTLETGRKSPNALLNPDDTDSNYSLGTLADANLHLEYRYNRRISAFLQFNNLAAQKYQRWYRYPVYGFQVLGGFTFGF